MGIISESGHPLVVVVVVVNVGFSQSMNTTSFPGVIKIPIELVEISVVNALRMEFSKGIHTYLLWSATCAHMSASDGLTNETDHAIQ